MTSYCDVTNRGHEFSTCATASVGYTNEIFVEQKSANRLSKG